MAYTLNSAKDSQGDEDQYVALANANAQKIYDYKAQHGGDYEHAFQAVTGKPWPAGRSLKMHNYQAEMTKDRTVKSVLGKYVAPIAAGVAAPFVLPALVGGGAAAGGAAAAGSAGTAAGTTAAAAGGGSLLHALLPSLIGAGASVGGAAIAAHGQTAAAKTQAEQDDKALALQKEMFDLQRSDLAPYRALGTGAVGNLAYLSGINMPAAEQPAAAPAPTAAPAPGGTLGSLGHAQPAGSPDVGQAVPRSGLVPMRNPNTGLVHLIPNIDVPAAQQDGGQVVQ